MKTHPTLDQLLGEARFKIEVSDAELREARARRNAIAGCLKKAFGGSRTYVNGSVAHGDALRPLADVDLGIVVPNPRGLYGPDGRGPADLMERAANAIRDALGNEYSDLQIEHIHRKRSVLVRFREPVADGRDFTADVIVAVDYPSGPGLYIPRNDSWDRSHPEGHTALVLQAIRNTNAGFARTVRLVKYWNIKHSRPLCSWNIKALALACLTEPMSEARALALWFDYAAGELAAGLTRDPTGVAAAPLRTRLPKDEAVKRLRTASDRLKDALAAEAGGLPVHAHDHLSKWLGDPDILPGPGARDLYEDVRTSTTPLNVGRGIATPLIPSRSWRAPQ